MILKLYLPLKTGLNYPWEGIWKPRKFRGFGVVSCVGQFFGENKLDIYKKWNMKGHNGLDIPCKDWQPVYAAQDGIVEEVSTEVERGLGVGIITEEKFQIFQENGGNASIENYNIKHRYWHFGAINVNKGDRVLIGDLLGWADNTGYSTGPHLHFETKAVEKNSQGVWYNVFQDNLFFGAIDPLPYIIEIYALDFKGRINKIKELLAQIAEKIADLLRKK